MNGLQRRSRATRARILDAANPLFLREGYLTTTTGAIAVAAGVSVQTLYMGFGSKLGILSAALDVAIAGDHEPVPLLDRAWVRELAEAPTGSGGRHHGRVGHVSDEQLSPAGSRVRVSRQVIVARGKEWPSVPTMRRQPGVISGIDGDRGLGRDEQPAAEGGTESSKDVGVLRPPARQMSLALG